MIVEVPSNADYSVILSLFEYYISFWTPDFKKDRKESPAGGYKDDWGGKSLAWMKTENSGSV